MKNIPYDKDYPLQRVEEGDAVEISVMHFPNKLVRDKDVKKYGHIPDGVYHAVAVAPYKLKCEQHPELSGYYNYWYGDKRGCSDGIYATECGKERRRSPNQTELSSRLIRENRIMDEYFVTVFPKEEGEMPQDFSSYAEAKEFADEEYGEGNYTIESPCY